MRVSASGVAKPPVRQRQGIVKAGRLRLDLESRLEVLASRRVVAARERSATSAIECGGIAGGQGQRPRKRRFRRVGTPLEEPYVTEPDERGNVVPIEGQNALEQ